MAAKDGVDGMGARSGDAPLRRLILFVHGLNGDADGTWGDFSKLIEGDLTLATFTTAAISYPTSLVRFPFMRLSVRIDQLAEELATRIETEFADYDEILIVAHSMGGVIARKFFVEQAKKRVRQRVLAMVLYAVPNMGSSIAGVGALLSAGHRHLLQLKMQSDFLNRLNEDWAAMRCGEAVRVYHVVAGQDRVVPAHSSRASWAGAKLQTVSDATHGSIVKPTSTNDLAYLILRHAALDMLPVAVQALPAAL